MTRLIDYDGFVAPDRDACRVPRTNHEMSRDRDSDPSAPTYSCRSRDLQTADLRLVSRHVVASQFEA